MDSQQILELTSDLNSLRLISEEANNYSHLAEITDFIAKVGVLDSTVMSVLANADNKGMVEQALKETGETYQAVLNATIHAQSLADQSAMNLQKAADFVHHMSGTLMSVLGPWPFPKK